MFDYVNMYYLLGIWCFAGVVALVPMFVKAYWAKLIVIPVVFFAIGTSFLVTEQYLGSPLRGHPVGEFEYVAHEISIVDSEKYIFLWSRVEGDNKLNRFPWSKEDEEKMEEAERQREQGYDQYGSYESSGHGEKSTIGKFEFYKLPKTQKFTK